MKLWKYTGEELIGGAEITSDVILAPEIEMPWESDKVEGIISMPNYATAPATGHKGLADQVLLERDGDAWKCVGYYVDDSHYCISASAKHWPRGHTVPSLYRTSKQIAHLYCS